MGVSWIGLVLRLIVLLVVGPAVMVIYFAAAVVGGLLRGGGGPMGGGRVHRGGAFGLFEPWLDPTRQLTGGLGRSCGGGLSDQLFGLLMRSLDGGGRPW